jgi:hypothetical protein
MDELNQELQSLINLACSHPPTRRQHRQALNSLFRSLLQSGRVWQNAHDLYEEALSETMLFVSQGLCRRYDASGERFWLGLILLDTETVLQ